VLHTLVADDAGGIWQFILTEVIVPATKNLIFDTGKAALERALFGESRPSAGYRPRTNYGGVVTRVTSALSGSSDPRPSLSRQARATHDFRDVVLSSRADAENVLDQMRAMIVEYGVASISDFYGLLGITSDFTDEKWGWEDLRTAHIRQIAGGHQIIMPRAIALS
jgi:hypothetical protein